MRIQIIIACLCFLLLTSCTETDKNILSNTISDQKPHSIKPERKNTQKTDKTTLPNTISDQKPHSIKPERENTQKTVCEIPGLELPKDFVVFAAGGYAGKNLDFQIDQSGHQATRMDVTINHIQTPVVLILGAYDPTIWNLTWTPGTQIIGVLASGYHKQVIAGLPPEIPRLISTRNNQGVCGYFYISPDRLGGLNPFSRRLFKQGVDLVYPAKEGNILIGDPLSAGIKLITDSTHPPESFYNSEDSLAGNAGLKKAVKDGLIRKATKADARAWTDRLSKKISKNDIPAVSGQKGSKVIAPHMYNAYVVLKPFTYPAGLTGRSLATFFIPEGIRKPVGDFGHSTVYNFNTMDCQGTFCDGY